MPEGDTIRRLVSTMNELFTGGSALASSPQGRFAALAEKINGCILERTRVHSEYMFIGSVLPETVGSEPQEWTYIHPGLYGWWRFNGDKSVIGEGHGAAHHVAPVVKGEWDGHSEIRWDEDYGQAAKGEWEPPEFVGQVCSRMYGEYAVADLIGSSRRELISNEERTATQAKLGPDPLDEGAREDREATKRFAEVAHTKKHTIGEIVMNQAIIAGVSNIYRADALFLVGISPYRKGSNISAKRLTDLWVLTCDLTDKELTIGRLKTMDLLEAPSPPLEDDEEAPCQYVYHRTGRPCLRCGTPVREALMQNHRPFWCPSYQC